MKHSALLFLSLLLAVFMVAAAADGGPMTGGNQATNPNGRPPRTESDVNGAPATTPALPPPMSGGDLSTNPNRPRTPTPTTSAPATIAPTTATPTEPATTSPAPLPTPTETGSDDEVVETPGPGPSQNAGEAIDFSVIKDDESNGADVIGEVEPAKEADGSNVVALDTTNTTTPEFGNEETANEAEEPAATAATPSPVSDVSNAEEQSSGRRSMATIAAVASAIVVAVLSS